MSHKPTAAGKSSFSLVNQQALFRALEKRGLGKGAKLLDLACGAGNYTLALAPLAGEGSQVFAMDLWKEGVEALQRAAEEQGYDNIVARVADAGKELPLDDGSVDICLLATVLHDLIQDGTHQPAMDEVCRVLRPGGTLFVVEFRKQAPPPGPPERIRLSEQELERCWHELPVHKDEVLDLGPQLYAMLFTRRQGS